VVGRHRANLRWWNAN